MHRIKLLWQQTFQIAPLYLLMRWVRQYHTEKQVCFFITMEQCVIQTTALTMLLQISSVKQWASNLRAVGMLMEQEIGICNEIFKQACLIYRVQTDIVGLPVVIMSENSAKTESGITKTYSCNCKSISSCPEGQYYKSNCMCVNCQPNTFKGELPKTGVCGVQ